MADEAAAIDTVVLAFAADPVARWTWPNAGQYLASMPKAARAFGSNAFTHGSAYATDDGAGAALWLPPGVHSDQDGLSVIMQQSVAPPLLDDIAAVFDQMAAYHPSEPHWYLPLIGVDPAHQGKGWATR